ncbi:hypothetical protein [Streptomyces violaceusniger]|uniref:hypothetical protein n=1 Tax=Streptomyces violaceusniger TaxID=68280 RepID=UPI0037F9D96B
MEITIPGALADFLAGTNLATGADDHDPMSKATREALDAGRRGRGRTLIITPTIDVLHVISEYAETLLAPRTEATTAERRAARLWIERAGHARPRLDTVEAEESAHFADSARKVDAVEHAEQVEAAVETVTEAEALYAAQLVTEADANDGTWRGEWIGKDTDATLFALPAEQGALFDDRAAVEAEPEFVAPEVTRASVDAYLAREYPALFAPEQPRPLELEPALVWAVTHRVVIRGEWQGFIMCGLGRREAEDRASVLRYTGSKAVEVTLCEHGPNAHRDARLAARCEGCGYQIPRGEQWHDACRPRPRRTPLERAREAAARDAEWTRALEASAAVADLDGEPPF